MMIKSYLMFLCYWTTALEEEYWEFQVVVKNSCRLQEQELQAPGQRFGFLNHTEE